jgi:hypothetical protein
MKIVSAISAVRVSTVLLIIAKIERLPDNYGKMAPRGAKIIARRPPSIRQWPYLPSKISTLRITSPRAMLSTTANPPMTCPKTV